MLGRRGTFDMKNSNELGGASRTYRSKRSPYFQGDFPNEGARMVIAPPRSREGAFRVVSSSRNC